MRKFILCVLLAVSLTGCQDNEPKEKQNLEILPLNWTATKICNLVVNYEKRTQKIQCQLQS